MSASANAGRSRPVVAVSLAFLSMAWWVGSAAAGPRVPSNDLDPTFGEGGVVITDLASPEEVILDVALQADGRILAMGSSGESVILIRYRPDGRLDPTFHVTTHPIGVAMAVQADQKIVIAGPFGDFMNVRFALERLNADGTVDSTFGQNGRVITPFPLDVRLEDVAIQEDGRIVASGEVTGDGAEGYVFARYLPSGRLDRSFGSRGVTVIQLTTDSHVLAQVVIQPDGKIAANGYLSANPTRLGLVRLEEDGSLDPTFGEGGVVIMTEFERFTTSALALQPDGGILSGGTHYNELTTTSEFGLVRHLPDGALDLGFGNGGLAHIDITGLASYPEGLALQPNGLIVQAGWSPDEGDENELDVVWWEPDGSLYSELHPTLFGFTSFGNAVVVQADGKAIVGGSGGSGFDDQRFGLARFLSS